MVSFCPLCLCMLGKQTRRNTPLEVEQVEQLALIARLLPHHGESPSLISQADGITVRQFSRALFQQHRPLSDIRRASPGLRARNLAPETGQEQSDCRRKLNG